MMKAVVSVVVVALFAFVFVTPAFATPGRTNAQGCHNSKTAGYHCHGTPARRKSASKPVHKPAPVKKKSANNTTKPVGKSSAFNPDAGAEPDVEEADLSDN